MELFKDIRSSVKPLPVDTSSEKYVYINENIEEYSQFGGVMYKYDQKRYTKEEYMEYIYSTLNDKIDGIVDTTTLNLEESIEYMIKKVGEECSNNIYAGVDVTMFNRITEHFSLTLEDQQNIQSLFNSIFNLGLDSVAYHADGKPYRIYDYYDFIRIYISANFKILEETTYCNFLNNHIRSLRDKNEVLKCYYGMKLSKEDQESIDTIVESQKNTLIEAIKSKYSDIVLPDE